jgi:uncharacterized protein DUF4242
MLYLVECYLPANGDGVEQIDARARAAVAELAGVRHVRSIVVPDDEMCVLHYDAPSRELALEAARRAGVSSDRAVEMLEAPR